MQIVKSGVNMLIANSKVRVQIFVLNIKIRSEHVNGKYEHKK